MNMSGARLLPPPLFTLLLVLLLLLTFPHCHCETANCNLDLLAKCDRQFRVALGLDKQCGGAALYENVACLGDKIEASYFAKGADAVLPVCNAYTEFRDCLGPANIRPCTSYYTFLRRYQPLVAAKLAQAQYTQLLFQCGPGLETVLFNHECIVDTFAREGPTDLAKCRTEFGRRLSEGESEHQCDYIDELTGCYMKYFRECGIEAEWWACEFVRVVADTFFPQCSSVCQTATK